MQMDPADAQLASTAMATTSMVGLSPSDAGLSPGEPHTGSGVTSKEDEEDSSNAASSDCKSPGQRYVNLWFSIKINAFFLFGLFGFSSIRRIFGWDLFLYILFFLNVCTVYKLLIIYFCLYFRVFVRYIHIIVVVVRFCWTLFLRNKYVNLYERRRR